MSGKGIPTIGNNPITMQMLMSAERIRGMIIPMASACTKLFLIAHASMSMRIKSAVYKARIISPPKKPSSSAMTEKIKSVRHSGKNCSLFCVPCKKPLPVMPPDPMAILDCSI